VKKVLITEPIHERGIRLLKKEVEVVTTNETSLENLLQQVSDIDGIIVRSTRLSGEIIRKEKGISVVYSPEAHVESVAEHVIGFTLVLAKNILLADRALREGKLKSKYDYIGRELAYKKLGIVGLGRIGLAVAKKCIACFNMKVLGYDPYILKEKQEKIESIGITVVDNLDILLEESDFISLNVPLNKKTKGMIGDRELRLMKTTAYLINTARGKVIDENALIKVLSKKEIAGAALDVFTVEPPRVDNPLFMMENVCVTPHIAISTEEALMRMAITVSNEVLKVIRGEIPKYVVNPEIWQK